MKLPQHIPAGMSVHSKRYMARSGGSELHSRYVFTDVGGVFFGRGFDRGVTGHSEDMATLEEDHFRQRWNKYVGPTPAFDVAGTPLGVAGIKQIQ